MIPLRDDIPSNTFPIVNYILIAVNLAVFGFELSLGRSLDQYIYTHAVIPIQVVSEGFTAEQFVRMTATMFFHGGWLHLLSNMLYLWIFGDNVEDRMGHFKYLFFYLIVGYLATFAHIFFYPMSGTPLVGASGAIAGVLGAYLILYPHARVLTLIFIFVFIQLVYIPALIFLGIWFVLQLISGAASVGQAGQSVAFWAHIGGFVAGMLLVKLFATKKANIRY
ncbi:MAG: rhomboid family intramembrane serine protease [Desulfotomaculaceae bacterium]|nr:rhomboid family intramembrane serine protease [Desulfotomaculaceae bacterium]